MDILTLDFETYYDKDYSLKKMTMVEYILDARYQSIILAYAFNEEPVRSVVGDDQIKAFLDTVDWDNVVVNGQNVAFDGAILAWRYGKHAKFYADTMSMARVTGSHVVAGGASLDKIAELLRKLGYAIPPKGKEVESAKGKRLYITGGEYYLSECEASDIGERIAGNELLLEYVKYCENDVELARQAFKYYAGLVTSDEMKFSDMILKCYIRPQFYLDEEIIEEEIERIAKRDKEKIEEIALTYFGGSVTAMRSTMRSVPKFTAFLKMLGGILPYEDVEAYESGAYRFEIPYAFSEKKGRYEPCYSKAHAPMIEMLEHEDEELQRLFAMKLSLTSSIERTRAETFLRIAKLNKGFPIPYLVSGAHTHRLSGGSLGAKGYNPQNLSSGRKAGQSNALRRSITAPEGYVCIASDSSQIELRTGSFASGDEGTLELFRQKKDPYSVQASIIYGGEPDEIKRLAKAGVEPYASTQRPVGKSSLLSCIYGTGAGGFQNYLKINGIDMDIEECRNVVLLYRQSHAEVVNIWRECERALKGMSAGANGYFGGKDGRLFYFDGSRRIHGQVVAGIRLPDGNWINYMNLHLAKRVMPDGTVRDNWVYWGQKEGRLQWIYTYSSKVFENINQALAFSVMKYQALLINARYPIAGNTHDEWFLTVPESEAEEAFKYIEYCMRQAPAWAEGLPLDCEGSFAKHYGDC